MPVITACLLSLLPGIYEQAVTTCEAADSYLQGCQSHEMLDKPATETLQQHTELTKMGVGDGSGDGTGEGDGRGEGEGEGRAGAAPDEGGNCALVWMSPWAVRVITPLQDTQGLAALCSSTSRQIAVLLQ